MKGRRRKEGRRKEKEEKERGGGEKVSTRKFVSSATVISREMLYFTL